MKNWLVALRLGLLSLKMHLFHTYNFSSDSSGLQIVAAEICLASPTLLTPAATTCTATVALPLLFKPLATTAPLNRIRQTKSLNSLSNQWQNVSCRSLACSLLRFTASMFMRAIDRSYVAAQRSSSSPEPSLQVSNLFWNITGNWDTHDQAVISLMPIVIKLWLWFFQKKPMTSRVQWPGKATRTGCFCVGLRHLVPTDLSSCMRSSLNWVLR